MSTSKRAKKPATFTSKRGHKQEGPSDLENILRGIPEGKTDRGGGPVGSMLEILLSYTDAKVVVSPQLMEAVGAGRKTCTTDYWGAPVAVGPLLLYTLGEDELFLHEIAEQCLRILSRAPGLNGAHRKHVPEPRSYAKLERRRDMVVSPGVAYKAFVTFKDRKLVCELMSAPSPHLYLATLDDN